MSITDSASSATSCEGTRNERPGARNTSITRSRSAALAWVIAIIRDSGVRPADLAVVRAAFGQTLEHPHGELPPGVARQRRERLVGVARQRVGQTADRLEIAQLDWPSVRVARLPVVPRAHQRVLQHRELVHVVADGIQQDASSSGSKVTESDAGDSTGRVTGDGAHGRARFSSAST
jgi:hypothetical protein